MPISSRHPAKAPCVHHMHPTSMMSVAAVLNPIEGSCPSPDPGSARAASETRHGSGAALTFKKVKLAKDSPVFCEGMPIGQVRYPPSEDFSELERTELAKLEIYPPLGTITAYPRHIPYSSDKKAFLQKTGREAFEVFQYTFRMPADERSHTVMWDYNVGLVRITPFFKCCRYAKTVPGKMLASNPGLKEICHSITGGALAAQGYWMPFEAAKAVAATFCHPIRFALLPIFGSGFAHDCLRPEDDGFATMVIDRAVIVRCKGEAASVNCKADIPRRFDGQSLEYHDDSSPETETYRISSCPSTPSFTRPCYEIGGAKHGRQKRRNLQISQNSRREDCIDYVRQQWTFPDTTVSNERGRRNGFVGSPDSLKYSYPPSPESEKTSGSDDYCSFDGEQQVVQGPTSAPYRISRRKLAPYPIRTLKSRSSVNSGADDCDSQASSVDGQSEAEAVSPRTNCAHTVISSSNSSPVDSGFKGTNNLVDGLHQTVSRSSKTQLGHPHVPCEHFGCQPNVDEMKAAWTLWQLHKTNLSLSKSNLSIVGRQAVPSFSSSYQSEQSSDANPEDDVGQGVATLQVQANISDSVSVMHRKRRAST